jgi:hypothetical protein
LAALQAGLELEPGTSPPVLRRIPGFRPAPYKRLGTDADARFDVMRGYLCFYGPASVKAIATFLEAPVSEVKANLPKDAQEVAIKGMDSKAARYVLADDLDTLTGAAGRRDARGVVRLAGSHDPYLQLRDREVLVSETPKQKDLWRTIGRPGAVLIDGEVAGTWRPRSKGKSLTIEVDQWRPIKGKARTALRTEAERLAAHRGVALRAVEDA